MIEFKNVSKVYGDGTKAVSNLSLTIEDGEIVVFIGTSGSGKTTSMRMINRMVEPTEGEITINGEDIKAKDSVELRRSIGYVIQQTGLMPHMTVYENIVMVPKLLKWDKKRMEETARRLLMEVDMNPDEFLSRYPSELSGGQQQRIGVIRALAADQEIVLMDEPFGALDPITRESLQDMVINLQRELGRTFIFVTHDMDEALDMADKIAVMSHGELVQYDTPKNILANPANEFVQELLGENRINQPSTLKTVQDIMIKTPITISAGTSVADAVSVMRDNRIDSLFVTDSQNILLGTMNVSNISQYSKANLVDEVMHQPQFYVKPETSLRNVAERMIKRDLNIVVVLNDQYQLQGVLTRSSLVDILYETIWGAHHQQPAPLEKYEFEEAVEKSDYEIKQ